MHEHPTYGFGLERWQVLNDVLDGSQAVKHAGLSYLPKLTEQETNDYLAYKKRANFVGFTRRTLGACTGMLLRHHPELEVPSEIERLTADVDMDGADLNEYVRKVTAAVGSKGRGGTFVDWNDEESRPYLTFYPAENIINWERTRIRGRMVLTHLSILEEETLQSGLSGEIESCVREYWLTESDGVYWRIRRHAAETPGNRTGPTTGQPGTARRLARPGDDNDDVETLQSGYLARKGRPVPFIPFEFHNATHTGPEIGESPLYDMAQINLSHYRTSADLENARHVTGLPTPYITGIDPEEAQKFFLGSSHAITAENPAATFGFLEFTGAGLEELRMAIEEKERQIALLGARLLSTSDKADAEAYETVKLRRTAETADLTNIAGYVSISMTQVLRMMTWWLGSDGTLADVPDQIYLMVNTDFDTQEIPTDKLLALIQGVQQGLMSFDSFFHNLKKGEMYPHERTIEEERRLLAEAPPASPASNPGNQNALRGDAG